MIRFSLAAVSAVFFMSTGASADAESCSVQSKNINDRVKVYQQAKADRDAAAEAAETAGETWEDVEIHRLVSTDHAATADEALAEYEAAKAAFEAQEAETQALGLALNEKIAMFNKRCARK